MIYRSLLKIIKCIDNNHQYCFAYWWVRISAFVNRFNPASSPIPSRPINVMNLDFPNPVGLAAGFDRDGALVGSLESAGFGFIEIGTINVNSEIESNDYVANIVRELQCSENRSAKQALVGVSLGSLRNTIDAHTAADYIQGMKIVWQYSDYIMINLSRPGSSMRSDVDNNLALGELLKNIKQGHFRLCDEYKEHVPVLVKVAIDYETRKTLPEILKIAHELEFDGLLVAFENWPSSDDVITTVGEISALTNNFPLIVVGGIRAADDVLQLLNAGANLVQCFRLLVDQGPGKMKKMIRKLPPKAVA